MVGMARLEKQRRNWSKNYVNNRQVYISNSINLNCELRSSA